MRKSHSICYEYFADTRVEDFYVIMRKRDDKQTGTGCYHPPQYIGM